MSDFNRRVNSAIDVSRSQGAFGTSLVPTHVHNGVDSPKLIPAPFINIRAFTQSQLVFTGNVDSSGNAGTVFPPSPWASGRDDVGKYSILHPLNTTNFVVQLSVVSATDGEQVFIYIHDITTTAISIRTVSGATGAKDYAFTFTVIKP